MSRPQLLVFCYHKSGTVLFEGVMGDIARRFGLTLAEYYGYVARVDPTELARIAGKLPIVNLALQLTPDNLILSGLLTRNLAPDFVLDRGHTFGSELSDADKHALIEFLKTF